VSGLTPCNYLRQQLALELFDKFKYKKKQNIEFKITRVFSGDESSSELSNTSFCMSNFNAIITNYDLKCGLCRYYIWSVGTHLGMSTASSSSHNTKQILNKLGNKDNICNVCKGA